MFPVPEKPDLSIGDIADYWSRETPATQRELREKMIRGWWRGTLEGPEPSKRLEALKVLVEQAERGEVAFLPGGTQDPPEIVERADGGADVDLRVRVPLPEAGPESWTDASCADAFEVLGKDWTEDMCVELVVGLRALTIARTDFMDWIERSDFAAPKFWGRKRPQKAPSKPLTEKATVEIVEGYLRKVKPAATMEETEAAVREQAHAAGRTAHRLWVREAYHKLQEEAGLKVRPGRRGNPPA